MGPNQSLQRTAHAIDGFTDFTAAPA